MQATQDGSSVISPKSAPENHDSPHGENAEESVKKGYNPPKGTATPKRRQAEKRNRRPLIADRSRLSREERRELKKEQRKKSDEVYRLQQAAMRTGDERHLPPQHKGKVRRWGRDYIDASFCLAAWFMPLAVLIVPLIFLQGRFPQIAWISTLVLYAIFAVMFIHALWLAHTAKKYAARIFGAAALPRGFMAQMLGRGFYPRRWRLPSPQVKRGEFPAGATSAEKPE